MSPTKLCEWGDHGLCSGLSTTGPCPCECHQEPSDPGPFTTECVWCHAPIRHRVDTSVTPPYEWWEADADYTTRATCQAIGEPDHLVMGGHQSVKDEWWLEDQESGDPS